MIVFRQKLQRWVDIHDRHGFRLFEMYHFAAQGGGKSAPRFPVYDQRQGKIIWHENLATLSPEYCKIVGGFLTELSRWLDQRGLSERFLLHNYDEPSKDTWSHYAKLSAFHRQHAPKLRQIDAISTSEIITQFGADIDMPVPLTKYLKNDVYWQQRAKKGEKAVWWYTCCEPPYPFASRFLSSPLLTTRILSWQTFAFGISGYLHWGYNFWHRKSAGGFSLTNPYRDSCYPDSWPVGDCEIVYPHPRANEDHGPISSLRYEAHRAGLQDYEMLKMLVDVAGHASDGTLRTQAGKLLTQVRGPIAGNLTDFTRDSSTLASVRQQVGDCLSTAGLS